jgi:hypothetical protein
MSAFGKYLDKFNKFIDRPLDTFCSGTLRIIGFFQYDVPEANDNNLVREMAIKAVKEGRDPGIWTGDFPYVAEEPSLSELRKMPIDF